jgi:hypothetical protein
VISADERGGEVAGCGVDGVGYLGFLVVAGLGGYDATHHLITNHLVTIDADTALSEGVPRSAP